MCPRAFSRPSAEVEEWVELYLHSPIRLHGVVLSDNFTFTYVRVTLWICIREIPWSNLDTGIRAFSQSPNINTGSVWPLLAKSLARQRFWSSYHFIRYYITNVVDAALLNNNNRSQCATLWLHAYWRKLVSISC